MAKFIYSATNAQGKKLEGKIEADNREAAINTLRRRRMVVNSIKRDMSLSFKLGTGISSKDVATFTRQFSAMTSAGLPLLQCLNILEEQAENPAMRSVVKQIGQKIQGGGGLAEALAMHPKIFDSLYCHMVSAGEAGGILDTILARLAEYRESAERLKRKVKGAMTYPAIIVIVAVLVVGILLTFVVPKFAEIFSQGGQALPGPTLVVVTISDFLKNNLLLIILGIVMGIVGFINFHKTPAGRRAVDSFKLKAPGIGNLETKSAVARFCRTLGTLLRSGVSLLDGLEVTSKTVGNVVLEEGLRKTQAAIRGGQGMAEPLKATGMFPPMVVQMVNVGEKTGGLPEMLLKVADFYDEEVDAAVDALTSMIEPLIIVFLGVVVGGILVAMYMPMFSMSDAVH
jgi:type IV pilus assembly protein PilC